jgi:hypothetical protein
MGNFARGFLDLWYKAFGGPMKSFVKAFAVVLGLALSFSSFAHADTATIDWPTRNSKVICGGSVDGTDLVVRAIPGGELMTAESANTRILIYIDLHKPGQVHWVISDSLNDDEYDRRQAIIAKLSPEDALLFTKITATHTTELFSGFMEGVLQMNMNYGDRTFSMSCQELAN